MTSVLQGGGFLNRMAGGGGGGGGGGSKNCISCSSNKSPSQVSCGACESHVCSSCIDAGKSEEMRTCETCSKSCCHRCRDVCHDPDCQAVHCKSCSSMEPCEVCDGVFCTETVDDVDDIECAPRCTCDKIICNNCNEECNLCNAVLCDSCLRECAKCSDVFCGACENFVVTCEFCDKEYCLICCAKKTPCVDCGAVPSRARLLDATAQLKRVQQGIQSGEILAPVAPIAGSSRSSSANSTAESEKEKHDKQEAARQEAESLQRAVAQEREQAEQEAMAAMAAKQRRQLQEKEEEKKRVAAAASAAEEKRKRAREAAAREAAAAADAAAAAASAADSYADGGQQKPRGTNMMPKKAKKKKGKKKGGGGGGNNNNAAPAPAPAPALAPAPAAAAPSFSSSSEMDYSVIKKWVLEVAAGRVDVSPDDVKRYFYGRVDADVIVFYLEELPDCRSTVIQCAEVLNIHVPADHGRVIVQEDDGRFAGGGERQMGGGAAGGGGGGGGGAMGYDDAQDDGEEEDDDGDNELLTGAFGAKERIKHGDFVAHESPLERRAQELKQNDCKDLKVLNDLLAEAKGEQGLGKMKKMVKKMIKRITEEREQQQQLRRQKQKESISQKLHPAYASKEPMYNSYVPPTIPTARVPDAIMDIPHCVVGLLIGKGGSRIITLQQKTKAQMWINQDFPDGVDRKLHIHGNKQQVETAMAEVKYIIDHAPANKPPAREPAATAVGGGIVKHIIKCPHALVGLVIGKKGAMVKDIKARSGANVELFQAYPDGQPRDVIITGNMLEVDLAMTMVNEVISAGTIADSSVAAGGGGPRLGFAHTYNQGSPATSVIPPTMDTMASSPAPSCGTPSVDAVTHDFGDLGGLRSGGAAAAGAAGATGMTNGGGRAGLSSSAAATQMAIDKLHQAPPPASGLGAAAGSGSGSGSPAMGVHEEYLAQQEGLRQRQSQMALEMQQQQWQQQQQAMAAPAESNSEGGVGGGNASAPAPPPPFGSVEELLAKAGQIHLLPNFLEQEFDVNAITLMEEQDFAEIGIPFGPQKKIQKAIREATAGLSGNGAAASTSRGSSAAAAVTPAAGAGGRDNKCAICMEREIEVTFVGCGHFICCLQCGKGQVGMPCPLCRTMVEQCVQPFTG